jgi:ASC-1-like (ASCH) protein
MALSRDGKSSLLLSPNSVLANALLRSIGALGALGTPPAQMPSRIFTPQVPAPTGAKLSKSLLREHGKGVLEMGIYKRYFDLIATGRKTTEIRVNDSSRKKIKEGSLIRFRCQNDEVLTRVTKVARYTSFEEMFDHVPVASVNPQATREEQLANIRQIYPPEREALGVVAIGIELIDPTRLTELGCRQTTQQPATMPSSTSISDSRHELGDRLGPATEPPDG